MLTPEEVAWFNHFLTYTVQSMNSLASKLATLETEIKSCTIRVSSLAPTGEYVTTAHLNLLDVLISAVKAIAADPGTVVATTPAPAPASTPGIQICPPAPPVGCWPGTTVTTPVTTPTPATTPVAPVVAQPIVAPIVAPVVAPAPQPVVAPAPALAPAPIPAPTLAPSLAPAPALAPTPAPSLAPTVPGPTL